jgi:hypothetical protein
MATKVKVAKKAEKEVVAEKAEKEVVAKKAEKTHDDFREGTKRARCYEMVKSGKYTAKQICDTLGQFTSNMIARIIKISGKKLVKAESGKLSLAK